LSSFSFKSRPAMTRSWLDSLSFAGREGLIGGVAAPSAGIGAAKTTPTPAAAAVPRNVRRRIVMVLVSLLQELAESWRKPRFEHSDFGFISDFGFAGRRILEVTAAQSP
jgi:hypothetical protein